MSRRVVALAALVALAGLAAPAGAEEGPSVRLRILSQRSLATPREPFHARVELTNTGQAAAEDLGLSLWIYHPATSRSAYDSGLESEPPTAPLLVSPFRVGGPLAPGETRKLTISRRIQELASVGANGLYPVKIELESAGVPLAVIRSALVFISERPLVPLNVSLTVVLDQPVSFGPDGTFLDDSLERALQPGGRIEGLLAALESRPTVITLAVSPILLVQLQNMANGYRLLSGGEVVERGPSTPQATRAGRILERLRALAGRPEVEVVALPYAVPNIASMVTSGLTDDVRLQLRQGQATVRRVLRAAPDPRVLRPPAAGISPRSIDALARRGVRTVILDPESILPPSGLTLSPPPTTTVPGSRRQMTAVLPDPIVAGRLVRPRLNPVLRAARTVGELSAIYFEQPSVDRGVSLILGDGPVVGHDFVAALLRGLTPEPERARWLRPVTTAALISHAPPADRRTLQPTPRTTFSAPYIAAIRQAHGLVSELASMTRGSTALPGNLRRLLLVSESRDFLGREAQGAGYAQIVGAAVRHEFSKVQLPSTSFTLTARGGVIPVTVRNGAGYDLHVRLVLESRPLLDIDRPTRTVTLSRAAHQFTFPVRAQTTGRFPVRIVVETPGGQPVAESQIVVRSTAYNRAALLVTIGAALVLALSWLRRYLPRPKA